MLPISHASSRQARHAAYFFMQFDYLIFSRELGFAPICHAMGRQPGLPHAKGSGGDSLEEGRGRWLDNIRRRGRVERK
jgi:hypothetical protein